MRIALVVTAIVALAAPMAAAQETPVIPFLPASSVGIHFYNGSPSLFEGAVFAHFPILRSKKSAGDPDNASRWALLFTPGVRVRLRRERSNPVRTPSYLPRIDFQKLKFIDRSGIVNVWEWHLSVGHHSNGENGCLFLDQTIQDNVCVPRDYAGNPEDRPVNNRDGSFSTNDARGGINFRHNTVMPNGQTVRDWTAGVEYQRQFGTDPDLEAVYTQNRINGNFSLAWRDLFFANRLKAGVAMSFAVDHPLKKVARWSFDPKVEWFPWRRLGLGLYARLYHGQDYYNLRFSETISHRVQVGIEFEQDGFLKFTPR